MNDYDRVEFERVKRQAALYGEDSLNDLDKWRLHRQRLTTVMLKAPRRFAEEVLWPEFEELNQALLQYLNAVTLKVIREEVHRDAGEAAEIAHGMIHAAASA